MTAQKEDITRLTTRQLCRWLNSTPIGTIITERDVRRIQDAAGFRIGDSRTVDLRRLFVWLRGQNAKAAQRAASNEERYAAKKAQMTLRSRVMAEAGREIGPSHPPVDAARRTAAIGSFHSFCMAYFQKVFYLPFSADHLRVMARIEEAVLRGGLFALAMPRGSGKSSLVETAALWALLFGHRQFVALIGATEAQAREMLHAVLGELSTNDLLAEDFNEIIHPIRALEGITHRCAGQVQNGKPTRIHIGIDEIVLPSVSDATGSSGVVRVAGLTGRIRGMKFRRPDGKSVRPDLVVIDDPQSDDSSRSLSQCASRERILAGAVLGLSGPGKKISGVMPCTVIRPGDVADTILNREKHPEWNGERTRMLNKLPSNEKAWARYREAWAESLRRHGDIRDATAYYLAHREELDAGAEASWTERFNPDETSAIQHGMNLKIQDEVAFAAEYQNDPLPEKGIEDEGMLISDQIAGKLNGVPRGVPPPWATRITAGVDVQQRMLFYVIIAWSDRFDGAVIDWGSHPDQHRAYYTYSDSRIHLSSLAKGSGQEGAIFAGLEALVERIASAEYKTQGGVVHRLERVIVDSGYKTDVVYQFCRQSKYAATLLPSKGWGVTASSKPFEDFTRKPGDRLGTGWKIPAPAARREIRHVIYDSNYWKSFLHSRIAVRMGDPGCLSLFGRQPDTHRVIADQLVSEYRIKTQGRGRVVDEWKERPDRRDNHLLDAAVLAAVAAAIGGSYLLETGDGQKPKSPKVSLAQRMAANRAAQSRLGRIE